MFGNFFSENCVLFEIMSKNMVEPERPQRVWRLRVTYWISKATCPQVHVAPVHPHLHTRARAHKHTELCNTYCFPRQQWFRERASFLRYT